MDVNRHWYRSSFTVLTFLLLPLSFLFHAIVSLRRACYRFGIKQSQYFSVPVIVVGNITVGGTGKTPFVIWLAEWLRAHNYKPGIVSRGYGGKRQNAPQCVFPNSVPSIVGDEAVLLSKRAGCPVVISIDRVAAVKALLASADCNIVISDDGLQHYRLGRQIEIAIVDGKRRFGNGCMLPAGPLREPISRLQQVDFVMGHGGALPGEYQMTLIGKELRQLTHKEERQLLSHFSQTKIHAVAAIGNPAQFFSALRAEGLDVVEHVFPDHFMYQRSDFDFGDVLPIIMTEKDAVKCAEFADDRFWYLPVIAEIEAEFSDKLLKKLGEIQCALSK